MFLKLRQYYDFRGQDDVKVYRLPESVAIMGVFSCPDREEREDSVLFVVLLGLGKIKFQSLLG